MVFGLREGYRIPTCSRRYALLRELTDIPTDALIDMVFVILASETAPGLAAGNSLMRSDELGRQTAQERFNERARNAYDENVASLMPRAWTECDDLGGGRLVCLTISAR